MMEEQKVRCPGCGEAHGGILTCKDGTSKLLEEYVKLVNLDFDDDEEDPEVNYEEIFEGMTWNGSSYDMGPTFKEKKKNYGLEMKITVLEKRLIRKLVKKQRDEVDKGFSSSTASPDLSETEETEMDEAQASVNQIGLQKENEIDTNGIHLILNELSKDKREGNVHVLHEAVMLMTLRNANKLNSWMSECAGVSGIPFHRICEIVEIEEQTLDILTKAGVNFNVLDRQKRNVLYAAIKGNQSVSFLKRLIKRGADVNQVDSIGVNLLAWAVSLGCTDEILEFLISEGVSVNGKRVEYSPMEMLVSGCVKNLERKFSHFKILVKGGAEPKRLQFHEYLKTGIGKMEQDFRELVEFIVSKGKMEWFNAPGSKEEGKTPLLIALACCKVDAKTLLVMAQAGVDFTKVDSSGQGALFYALIGRNWSPPVLQTLINNKADVTLKSENKATLLHTAAAVGAPLETLEFLVKKGLSVETEDIRHNTPLEHAVAVDRKCISKMEKDPLTKLFIWSIDAAAKYSKAEAKGKLSNLLHLSISHGTPDVVEYILKKKVVDVNKPDEVGLTPFMFAIGCDEVEDSKEKARLLVQYGADFCKRLEGQTAVHVAAKTGSVAALMYCLIELRLNVDDENIQGNTPLLDILFEQEEEKEKEVTSSLLEKAQCLVLQGAYVNDRPYQRPSLLCEHDRFFDTPFHWAVKAYKKVEDVKILEFINCLLENNADVNGPNLEEFTALHTALSLPDAAASLNLVNLLEKHGGDFQAKTPTGQTALHLAAKTRNVEMMELCLDKGLDVNDLDKYGKCPLDYTVPTEEDEEVDEGSCMNGMKFLLKNGATKRTKQRVKKEIQKRIENCKNKKLLEIPLHNLLSLFM